MDREHAFFTAPMDENGYLDFRPQVADEVDQIIDNAMATFPRTRARLAEVEPSSPNPKKQYGTLKPSISFIPPVALLELAVVMELGAVKYGAHNWVTDPVDFTTYYDAAMRHLMLAFSGEDIDDESKALHVAHAMACCAILTDAIRLGNLVDDRPKTGDVARAIRRLTKPSKPTATASEEAPTATAQAAPLPTDEDIRLAVERGVQAAE